MDDDEIRARFNELWPHVQEFSTLDDLLKRFQIDLLKSQEEDRSRERAAAKDA